MKTKARLYLSLGSLTALVFVLAAVSMTTIWQLRSEGRGLLKANYRSIEYMQDMLAVLESPDTVAADSLVRLVDLQRKNITEDNEAEATEELAANVQQWRISKGDSVSSGALHRSIATITELNRNAIVRRASAAEAKGENALVWISLTGAFCAMIALSMLFSIPEHFMEPIRKLTEGIDRIAEGRYHERVELNRTDEFGHMAVRFNAMAAELERWGNSNLALIMDEKARAEAVINSLQDASLGLDEQGNILFANQQALDLLAMDTKELVGKPGTEAARTSDLLRVLLSGGRPGPLKIVKDGKEQFFTLEHLPIARGSERLGTVVVLRNVTPFEEKDRAKSHFMATISHELKTPLASTDIGLTLLERQLVAGHDPQSMAILADLRTDHQRLVRIVSELLDLTQVESGNIKVHPTDTSLDQLLHEALAAVKLAGQQKDLLFAVRNDHGDLHIRADADKAVWVLVNVLSNAVRHSPERGIVTIEATKEDDRVHLAISDQGPGIPAPTRTHLFERFTPGSHAHHGTGLGLSIAREFMQAMGGSIAYQPAPVEGATFILTFAAPLS